MKEYEHWCGCITFKKKGVVYFKKMCDRHKKNNKYVWVANNHKDE